MGRQPDRDSYLGVQFCSDTDGLEQRQKPRASGKHPNAAVLPAGRKDGA